MRSSSRKNLPGFLFLSLNGVNVVKIFNRIYNVIYYWFDSYKANYIKTKIEKFQFDHVLKYIVVVYRIGNKRLLDKLPIITFEHKHFDNCHSYDQHRLTKFSILQKLLSSAQQNNSNFEEE